jgi:hypothetical protein
VREYSSDTDACTSVPVFSLVPGLCSEGRIPILPARTRGAAREDAFAASARQPFEEVAAEAKELTMILLERPAVSRLGAGWLALPAESTRWWLPRGPRRVASEALRIHQPVTLRGRTGWEVARMLARAGAFRYLPRGEAPPEEVRRTLAPHLPRGGTFAVSRSRYAGRHLAAILDGRGALRGIAKVATNPAQTISLEREAEMIKRLAGLLPVSVRAPQVLAHGPGLLILEPIEWRPRSRPWILDEELAAALGAFFLAGGRETSDGIVGPSHGDVAPWNLLRTSQSWVLVDWESATADGQPFFDVCHYVVQGYGLLGHPSARQVVEGFEAGRGWVGRAVHAYAEAGGLPADTAIESLRSYLAMTTPTFVPKTRAERRAIKRRDRLLELVG